MGGTDLRVCGRVRAVHRLCVTQRDLTFRKSACRPITGQEVRRYLIGVLQSMDAGPHPPGCGGAQGTGRSGEESAEAVLITASKVTS